MGMSSMGMGMSGMGGNSFAMGGSMADQLKKGNSFAMGGYMNSNGVDPTGAATASYGAGMGWDASGMTSMGGMNMGSIGTVGLAGQEFSAQNSFASGSADSVIWDAPTDAEVAQYNAAYGMNATAMTTAVQPDANGFAMNSDGLYAPAETTKMGGGDDALQQYYSVANRFDFYNGAGGNGNAFASTTAGDGSKQTAGAQGSPDIGGFGFDAQGVPVWSHTTTYDASQMNVGVDASQTGANNYQVQGQTYTNSNNIIITNNFNIKLDGSGQKNFADNEDPSAYYNQLASQVEHASGAASVAGTTAAGAANGNNGGATGTAGGNNGHNGNATWDNTSPPPVSLPLPPLMTNPAGSPMDASGMSSYMTMPMNNNVNGMGGVTGSNAGGSLLHGNSIIKALNDDINKNLSKSTSAAQQQGVPGSTTSTVLNHFHLKLKVVEQMSDFFTN